MIISPRIDSLDCDDVGPYLPHGLGSVNSMMLGASVRTSRHNVFQVFLRSPDVSAAFQQLSCLLHAAAFVVQCAQDLAHTLKHALNSHEPLTDECRSLTIDIVQRQLTCLQNKLTCAGLSGTSSVARCLTTAA